jgi:hypothetical protein
MDNSTRRICGTLWTAWGCTPIAIDNAILTSAPTTDYLGNPVTAHDMLPWGDTSRDIVPGAPVVGVVVDPINHNPKFKKPSPGVDDVVTPFLKTGKVYQPGDFRGDVAGSTVPSTPTPGAAPTGYDGRVDAKDIDYVCRNFGNWSNLDQAVNIDLSCDMNGDLVVNALDVDELVLVILSTHYGDRNLDGVVDAADEPQGPFPHPGGWADGSFDCDGMVTQADHDIWQANLQQSCTRTISSRGLFYNNSCYDGSGNGCTAVQCATVLAVPTCNDDTAIDPTKAPQLPGGGVATITNYSSFTKGINGISIDVAHSASCAALTAVASNFTFTVGNVLNPVAVAPAPSSIVVTALNATTDRIKIFWPDFGTAGALPNHNWLKVVVKSQANGGLVGLAADDTFYWGLAVGEDDTPNTSTPKRATVTTVDEIDARNNPTGLTRINMTNVKSKWDYNKSSLVDTTDQILSRNNQNSLSALLLFPR